MQVSNAPTHFMAHITYQHKYFFGASHKVFTWDQTVLNESYETHYVLYNIHIKSMVLKISLV
jgi:hypothetical protein